MTRAHLPRSVQRDLRSCGRGYRLRISLPQTPPPPEGWPALLVLDGDAYFGLATDATRNRGDLAGEIEPCVVVAIGYPDEDVNAWHSRRVYDYTPAGTHSEALLGEQGGLDDFLRMLECRVMPLLAREFNVAPARSALWGHSLGGLAAVWALLTRPTLCRSYLAVSPALWVAREAIAAQKVTGSGKCLHIAVGALEETPPPNTGEVVIRQLREARMVSSAREFAQSLSAVESLSLGYQELAGESHVSAPYAALREALDLAFPPVKRSRDL